MSVEVRVPGLMRKIVGGAKTVKAEGKDIKQVIDNLETNYPGFKSRLFDDNGKLHMFVGVYLNDEDIRFLKELDTTVKDGDVISILPAAAGGQSWNW